MTGSAVLHGSSPWHGARVSRPLQVRENGQAAMTEERRLVFVGWGTSTVDPCGAGDESYVIDLDDCGYVIDGDDWHDDAVISELARDHGVSVADLWAAYKREQQRETETAITPNETTVERCGQYSDGTWDYSVTFVFDHATITVAVNPGADVDNGWFYDDDDGGWQHCGRRAHVSDDGVTCSKCQEDWPDDGEDTVTDKVAAFAAGVLAENHGVIVAVAP